MTKQIRLKDGKVLKVESCRGCRLCCECMHKNLVDPYPDNCPLEEYQDPAAPKDPGTTTGTEGYLDKAAVKKAICNLKLAAIMAGDERFRDLKNLLEGIERGEFDAKFPPLFSERNASFVKMCEDHGKALAEKDAEIAILQGSERLLIFRGKELENEIARLKRDLEFSNQQRDICADNFTKMQSRLEERIAQQDQELKDLGKALEEKKTSEGLSDFFKGMKILEASSTQESEYLPDPQNINENIRVGTGIWNIHIRAQQVKKEPPKDEPELVICPNPCDLASACAHSKPHRKWHADCRESGKCPACIPYKKPTVPQEPAHEGPADYLIGTRGVNGEWKFTRPTVPQAEQPIDIPQAHTAQIEACQNRLDTLADRVDALETRVRGLDNVFCNCPANKFPDFDRRIKECEERTMAYPARNTWQLDLEKHDRDIGALTLRLDNAENVIQKIQENKA